MNDKSWLPPSNTSNDNNWKQPSTTDEGWLPSSSASNDDNWKQPSTTDEGWGRPRVPTENNWPQTSTYYDNWGTQGVQTQAKDDWANKQESISTEDVIEPELEINWEDKQASADDDEVIERTLTPPQDQDDNRVIKQVPLSDDDEWITSDQPSSSQDRENDSTIKQAPTPEEEVEWVTSNPPTSVHDRDDQWKKPPFHYENNGWNRKRSSPSEDIRIHKRSDMFKDTWGGKGRSEGSWEVKKNDANDSSLKFTTTTRARSVDQHSKIISNNSNDPMEMESDDLSTLAMQEVIHNSFTTLQIKKHNERNQMEEFDLNDNLNSVPPEILQKTVRTYIQHPAQ
ncbi:11735_t:CDS:2, partial [Racocetra persica]